MTDEELLRGKYVKIVSTKEMFLAFKLNHIFNITGFCEDGLTFYTRYNEDKCLEFYMDILNDEGLLDYIESISIVAREERIVETYRPTKKVKELNND